MKLNDSRFSVDKRKYFFTQQVVKLQNSLPEDDVVATSMDGFKRELV